MTKLIGANVHQDFSKNLQIVINFLTASDPIENVPVCDAVFLFGSSKTNQIPKSGLKLLRSGFANKIICTGKYGPGKTSGPYGFATEAQWYEDILIRSDVPKKLIILETNSTNTLENVLFGISACHAKGFYPKSLILCCIPYLCRRSLATFNKQFPEIRVHSYKFHLPMDFYLEPIRISRALSEFDRFEKYAEKGDIVSVEIPENIQKTVDFLKINIATA